MASKDQHRQNLRSALPGSGTCAAKEQTHPFGDLCRGILPDRASVATRSTHLSQGIHSDAWAVRHSSRLNAARVMAALLIKLPSSKPISEGIDGCDAHNLKHPGLLTMSGFLRALKQQHHCTFGLWASGK